MTDLARTILAMRAGGASIVYGEATDINTVSIEGAATAVALPALTPVVTGDYCAVLQQGADRLILGAVNAKLTQSAATSLALDANGRGSITFPEPFGGTPTIVVSVTFDTTAAMTAHVVTKSATGFTVQVDADAVPVASQTRQVNWIAIGVLA